jgi:ABC-type Zn uptake system ZnuABC Zn-binding protein ZnuA
MKKLFFTAIFAACLNTADAQTARFTEVSTVVDVEHVLSDTLYSARVYVTFSDIKGIVPNFVKDTNVVSSNFQTGFEVDAQRLQAVNELVGRVND